MFYRDYKRFEQKKFETELKLKLNSQANLSYSTFQAVFLEILKKDPISQSKSSTF